MSEVKKGSGLVYKNHPLRRIDATLNAEVVFADYQRTHPDANIQMAAFSDEPERVAIPVRKGAPPCWRPSTTLWPRWTPTVPCPGCP